MDVKISQFVCFVDVPSKNDCFFTAKGEISFCVIRIEC